MVFHEVAEDRRKSEINGKLQKKKKNIGIKNIGLLLINVT